MLNHIGNPRQSSYQSSSEADDYKYSSYKKWTYDKEKIEKPHREHVHTIGEYGFQWRPHAGNDHGREGDPGKSDGLILRHACVTVPVRRYSDAI